MTQGEGFLPLFLKGGIGMEYRMKVEELKPIIDEILKYYFNRKTRFNYDSKIQYNMLAQNKGLTNACYALIEFCDDKNALVEYTNSKIEELNNGEVQNVMVGGAEC